MSEPDKENRPQLVPVERLTYNVTEACAALGVSEVTLWRLTKRGLIARVPGVRSRLYPVASLRRFVNGGAAA